MLLSSANTVGPLALRYKSPSTHHLPLSHDSSKATGLSTHKTRPPRVFSSEREGLSTSHPRSSLAGTSPDGLSDVPETQLPVLLWSTLKSVAVTGWVLPFHSTPFSALYRGNRAFGHVPRLAVCTSMLHSCAGVFRHSVLPDRERCSQSPLAARLNC